jgi:hypothetical protein
VFPLTRVHPAARVLVAGLATALLLALAAAPASAVSRDQATDRALSALGAGEAGGPVVVFALPKPVHARSRVTQGRTRRLVLAAGRERTRFFYRDAAPGRPYPHPGQVALVGVRSGKVRVSRTIMRAPRVNGRVPVFLRSPRAYESSRYRVFERSAGPAARKPDAEPEPAGSAAPAALTADDPFAPLKEPPNSPPKALSQNLTVKQNSPKRVTLTAADDDGDPLTFHVTKQPLHGTLTGQPPDVVYTPATDYLGPDHFVFKARDDDKDSNAAQISLDVKPPGSPPTVTTSAGCNAYVEQGPGVVVDGQLTVSDPDDTQLDSATVRIADNFQNGDNLLFTDQNGIISSYDADAGVLTLTGTASVANYQAALRSVKYRNLASGNATPTKDIEFTANDAGADSAPATKQVCITGGEGGDNDPPTGENSEGGLSYVENDGPVPVDGGFVVGDPDSPQLSGAQIKFVPLVSQPVDENGDPVGPPVVTDTFAPAEDQLGFTDQNGITGDYDETTGVLTLTGAASLADYETAMRSATYENTSEDPSDAIRRIQFRVTDSDGASSTPVRRDAFITPVNDAPEVDASDGATDYTGSATPVDAALSAIDVDDDDLEGAVIRITAGFVAGDELFYVDQAGIAGSYDSGSGVLTLTGTAPVADYETALRSIAYRNTEGTPTGARTVEFATNDGDLDSSASAKAVEINDQPVLGASATPLSYTEGDGAVAVDDAIAATDPESAQLAGATVAITSGFEAAEDELAFVDQSGIAGAYDDGTGVLTLTGAASVADYETALRSVTYENGSDAPSTARTITFQADDGAPYNNLSDAVTRDVAITPVNDAPQVAASAGATAYTEGDSPATLDSAVTVSDADDADLEGAQVRIASGFQDGDELSFSDQPSITGQYTAETGVLTLTGTAPAADYEAALRTVEYRHTGDDPSAEKSVEFTANDGELDSSAATKDVAVTAVNDKPVLTASDTELAYTEGDGPVAVDDAIAASDPDSAQLEGATVAITGGFAEAEDALAFADSDTIAGAYDDATGVLTLTGVAPVADYEAALRSVTYENASADPSADTRTVTFQVDDGAASDNLSDAVTRDVAVTAVNDGSAPVVTTSAGPSTYTIGDPAIAIDDAVAVSDADDANLESAQVKIATGFEAGDEVLFTDQSGITGAYDSGTGVLTLTGTATVGDYEAALRSVQYRYTGENPDGARVVELTANDGDASSAAADKALLIVSPPI